MHLHSGKISGEPPRNCKTIGPIARVVGVISVLGFVPMMPVYTPHVAPEASLAVPRIGGNTASGINALEKNTTGINNTAIGTSALASNLGGRFMGLPLGSYNTASGSHALSSNTIGIRNTASGYAALQSNTTGSRNTAIGYGADVSSGEFVNATAIGGGAIVDANNKIRLGNTDVAIIEGQTAFTYSADKTQQEKLRPVNGAAVLQKIRDIPISSWNFTGQDSTRFRHYGPTAQDFHAAFGKDGVGTIGTNTMINSGDMAGILMIAIQTLEKQSAEQTENINRLLADNAALKAEMSQIRADDREDPEHAKRVRGH